jgi:hypothetical protein
LGLNGIEPNGDSPPKTPGKGKAQDGPTAVTKSVYNLIDKRSISDKETLEILGMVEKKAAQLKGSFGKLGQIERRVAEMREAGEVGI